MAVMRIKLVLEPPELAELPWEILRPPEWAFFPACSELMPVVRQTDLLGEHRSLDVNGPLKVLLVAASPTDQRPLNLKKERDLILDVLQPMVQGGKVKVTSPEPARKRDVLDAIREGGHHVLHFMMHADFNPADERGFLALMGDNGQTERLDAEELALALRANPEARLLILNACRTAEDSLERPGRGLAAAAVSLNLPAVVAMQYPISDRAAVEFTREFYDRLVKGRGVDEAVSFARQAIKSKTQKDAQNEWLTPVLYLRSNETHLFPGTTANPLDFTGDAKPAKELS